MGAAASIVLGELAQRLVSVTTREGWTAKPDQVKQARITTRRLSAALELFGPWLQPKQAKQRRRELRRLAARLGPVRELDATLAVLAPKSARDQRLLVIHENLLRQRRAAEVRLQRRLTGVRLEEFMASLRGYLASIESIASQADLGSFAASMLWQRHADTCRRAAEMDIANLRSVHAVRRSGRRMRYDTECLQPWLQSPKRVLRPLLAAQAHLGELTDREVTLATLRTETGKLTLEPTRLAVARVGERLESELSRLLAGVPRKIAPLLSLSFRRNLARAVAIS